MTAAQRKRHPADGTAEAADRDGNAAPDYGRPAGKARLTKSDAARLLSIWLDRVYDNNAVPASGFKLSYRIAKRCRATFAKEGKLHSFEGKGNLATSAGISEKQVGNLISILVEQHLLRVVRRGKSLTNLLVPALSDRNCVSDHIEESDRQSVSGQEGRVTGNPVPSDRQSSSRLTGNGFPIHIEEGVELRGEVEGGEGFQPSPSSPYESTNSESGQKRLLVKDGADTRLRASGRDHPMLLNGDEITVATFGLCIVVEFGLIGKTRFLKTKRPDHGDLVFVPVSDSDRLLVNDAMFEPEFGQNYRVGEWRRVDPIDCPLPRSVGRKTHAA